MQTEIKRMNMWVFIGLLFFAGALVYILGILGFIAILVISIVFHYRMWSAVYDEHVKVSPVLAVVLLHIPGVNAFWAFWFYPGFAKYYNEFVKRYDLVVTPTKKLLYYIFPVIIFAYTLSGILPFFLRFDRTLEDINNTIFLITILMFFVVVVRTCTAVNALADVVGEKKTEVDS